VALAAIKWPSAINEFNLKPLALPPSNPYSVSAGQAGVMSSFKDPTKPDFLLSRWNDPVSDLVNIQFQEEGPIPFKVTNERVSGDGWVSAFSACGCVILTGSSGSGKTRWTLQMASRTKWVALLVADRKGNGGSKDVASMMSSAAQILTNVSDIEGAREMIITRVALNMAFRTLVLEAAINKYGDAFTPAHWTVLQLYPSEVLKADAFHLFNDALQTNLVNDGGAAQIWTTRRLLKYVVLDESQIVDQRHVGKFPSRKFPTNSLYNRSLLSPMIEGLEKGAGEGKVILCGTGLNVVSAYDTARSTGARGVQPGCFGMSSFFNAGGVARMLQWAGVTDLAPSNVLERFAGRPRDSAILAQTFLENGEVSYALAEQVAKQRLNSYNHLFGRLYEKRADSGSARVRTRGTLEDNVHKSVGTYARERALDFVFGGDGTISDEYLVNLMEIGVCSLKHQSSGQNVAVIAEPLCVEALSDFAGVEFERSIEAASLGDGFERYVVWHLDTIVEFINAELERAKERSEAGLGATAVPSLSSSSARSKRSRRSDVEEGGGATAAAAVAAASPLASYIRPWRLGPQEADARRAQKMLDGKEVELVKMIMTRGSSLAIFPGTKMGPDVIFVLHSDTPADGAAASSSSSAAASSSSSSAAAASSSSSSWQSAAKLIVLVQCRSGNHKTTPDALRTLQFLYAEGRSSSSSGTIPKDFVAVEKEFRALFKNPDTLLALLVIKPQAASQGTFPRVADGALELVLDASKKDGLELKMMKEGFENIHRVRTGARQRKDKDEPQADGDGGGDSRAPAAKRRKTRR